MGSINQILIQSCSTSCSTKGCSIVVHERTNHIEIVCHYIREEVQAKQVKLFQVKTEDMIADILTKPLGGALFTTHLS